MTELVDLMDSDDHDSTQLDLFSLVDAPEDQLVKGKYTKSPYSNSIGSIDFIPRFKRGNDAIIPVLGLKGRKLTVENHYRAGRNELICKLKPALITRTSKGVKTEHYAYPGDREEMIERVIFLIASNRGLEAIRNLGGVPRFGIYFTLYEIREELKKIKKTRSYDVIREALIVIRDSKTSICQINGDKEVSITHDIFADAVLEVSGTGRGRDRCCITFSDYVIEEIQQFNYRQYPFASINSHDTPLARFMHHYLTNTWLNVVEGVPRKLYVNEIFSVFGKNHIKMTVKRRDIRTALEVLVSAGWFLSVPYSKKTINNSVVDYYYAVTPTEIFVEEVIKASAKKKGLRILGECVNKNPSFTLPQTDPYLV